MSERGQVAWTRCEMAVWRMLRKETESRNELILWDLLRDMANLMTAEQLEQFAVSLETMIAERRTRL